MRAEVSVSIPSSYVGGNSYWLIIEEIGLSKRWADEWKDFTSSLNATGCRLLNGQDKLIWYHNSATGILNVKTTYMIIAQENTYVAPKWWYKKIWKWHVPLKIKFFF